MFTNGAEGKFYGAWNLNLAFMDDEADVALLVFGT